MILKIALFLALAALGVAIWAIRRLQREKIALEREEGRLRSWLRKYEGRPQPVRLTQPEKSIVLDALQAGTYRSRIEAPATKKYIRNVDHNARLKIKKSMEDYRE